MADKRAVGFLGGTGVEGRGLALRLGRAGIHVMIGSRSAERARGVAYELNQQLGQALVGAAENHQMLATAEIVFLTVPFEQAAPAVEAYRDAIRADTVLVDVTVPVKFARGRPHLIVLQEGSGSESLARRLPPGVALVAAFKTIPAHLLGELSVALDCDVFVCGDRETAKAQVMDLVRLIPGLRPVDAGGLEAAGTLERMSLLAIGLNRRYKVKSARFRVVGL